MRDYITLGPTPAEEDCAQVGTPDYRERAMPECRRYREQLLREFGPPPGSARLAIKSFPHDFGDYLEVVCHFDGRRRRSGEVRVQAGSGSINNVAKRGELTMQNETTMWAEYDAAAEWCARRGLKGDFGDSLPELLGRDTYKVINADREAFAERVRATAYMLAREEQSNELP